VLASPLSGETRGVTPSTISPTRTISTLRAWICDPFELRDDPAEADPNVESGPIPIPPTSHNIKIPDKLHQKLSFLLDAYGPLVLLPLKGVSAP
jgi:hypothetical protein